MLDVADLPPQIVPVVEAFAQRLAAHVRSHREASLEAHEQGVLDAWRAEAAGILSGVVTAATSGADPGARAPRSPCPHCAQGRPASRWRPRIVETRLGPIAFTRTGYICAPCGQTWSAADQTLGLAPYQRTSAGLAQWAARLGALTTFREAAVLLADLTGVPVGTETLRTHAERVGTDLERQQRATMAHVQATQEPPADGSYDPAPGVLVVETDGVMVRYRDRPPDAWHEVKLGLVGGWADGHLRAPSYVAARESARPFAVRLGAEAARRGALDVVSWRGTSVNGHLTVLRRVVVLGDGAKWIWDEVAPTFGTERIEIVDRYHASQHLWTLAKALNGDGTAAATAWAEHAQHVLWCHGSFSLFRLLKETAASTPAAAEVLRRERGYFATNAPRMEYPTFRTQGLPIGSGAIESGAKHLVQQRLKRAGMRWSELGARAILDLRTHLLSGRPLPSAA